MSPQVDLKHAWIVGFAVTLAACGGGSGDVDAGDVDRGDVDAVVVDAGEVVDAGPGCGTVPATTVVDLAVANQLTIAGDPPAALGIFDPSPVYPAGAPAGAMSYSSVPDQHSIRTHIALSADAGASWTFVVAANAPVAATVSTTDTVACPGGTCTGWFIDEVSSLIIDPDEPDAARRWKLFTHRYLAEADNTLHYAYGTIALYTAPAPEGPWAARAPVLGWDSASPVSSTGVGTNVNDVAGLEDCVALTEPGALWLPGVIDLVVGCVHATASGYRIRVELLRSTDHAATFTRVATMLDPADAACVDDGTPNVNAAGLFVAGGEAYLVATVSSVDGLYAGCQVYAVDDPATGALVQHDDGSPVVQRMLAPADARFNGACGVAEGASAAGYLQSVLFLDGAPRVFRIVKTGVAAP